MKMNKTTVIGVVILVGILGIFLLNKQGKSSPANIKSDQASTSRELTPVDAITHGHGLAVDVADPTKVYIATHHGLLVLINDKDLFRIGDKQDDYMGFSPHPTNSKVFFSSGHPASGGNIGFQKSEDGGFTWKKVSDGVNGPVDFHAMTVSPVNPDLIFGWYQGAIQASTDGGKSWEIVSNTTFPIISLVADPKDENVVYVASPQGLLLSKNKGKDWSVLFDGFVSTIAINPQDSQKLISFSEKYKLARSTDGGKSWKPVNESFSGETPLHTAFAKQNPEIVYMLTEKNSLYKSIDSGDTWSKVR